MPKTSAKEWYRNKKSIAVFRHPFHEMERSLNTAILFLLC